MSAEQTSAEVAAWGRQWLTDWTSDVESEDARSVREEVAAGWLDYSLEDWGRAAARPSTKDHRARSAAGNHLSLYTRERNGLLVWRAYRELRDAGLPVPESILSKFDDWARRLESASGAAEVALAVEMTGPAGGPQGAKHLAGVERQRRIVSEVEGLIQRGVRPAAAERRVATENRITVSAVHSMRDRWARHCRQRGRSGAVAAQDILRMLGRPSREL